MIAGLMDPVYQSHAYEALQGVLVIIGKRTFNSGEQRKKGQVIRETKKLFGNLEHKKANFQFGGKRKQA